MRITRQNYEAYFIDYVDGQLSKELEDELVRFLEEHPDLKEELEAFDSSIKVDPDTSVSYPQKPSLKKEVHQKYPSNGNIRDWFIAYYEEDLDFNQQKLLFKFLDENPDLKREFAIFGKLTLKADENVVFKGKAKLKQKQVRRKALLLKYTSYAAAAAVLLLAGLFWLFDKDTASPRSGDLNTVAQYDIREIEYGEEASEAPAMKGQANIADITRPLSTKELDGGDLTRLSMIASLDEELRLNPHEEVSRRYDQTSEYYYQSVQLDLEYYSKVKEYAKKNIVEQLAYRLKNKIIPPEDYYVTDPGFSPLNILGIGINRFDELADAEQKNDQSSNNKTKKYSIKTPLFEFSHKRTPIQNPSEEASE